MGGVSLARLYSAQWPMTARQIRAVIGSPVYAPDLIWRLRRYIDLPPVGWSGRQRLYDIRPKGRSVAPGRCPAQH